MKDLLRMDYINSLGQLYVRRHGRDWWWPVTQICVETGFPLPIKRVHGEGHLTQEYRPLAVLEFVQEVVAKEAAQRVAAAKKADAEAEEQATP